MTSGTVARAMARAFDWLVECDSPEATITAGETGSAGTDVSARRWIRRFMDEQDPDGSWGGDLAATGSTLLTIAELKASSRLREQPPGIGRALDWMRDRRGASGAWSEGCSPSRHQLRTCHHFVGGFFSPAPPEVPQDHVRLSNGARPAGEDEARFVASTITLRCLLTWSGATSDIRIHMEALRRIVSLWPQSPPPGLGSVALLEAIHALLASDAPEDTEAAHRGLRVVAGRQRGDGSWVDTDPFQALEVFGAAEAAEVAPDRAHRALWHGARLLVSTQAEDGSWGGEEAGRRALIAWRTLRRVGSPAV